ncbi:MAG: hypothetical protein GC185_04440 [Alphaproteobacteria bacterium]|nr:hypothetical protein [Alphaproteobacteria bacterium]
MAQENKSGRAETGGVSREQYDMVNQALLEAVDAANYERIDLCLKKGADINTRNGSGRTPVMMAVWKENPALLQFILNRKPDLFLKDGSGKTAYDLLKSANDKAAMQKMTDILLRALPDAPPKNAAPEAASEAGKGFNDVATREEIRVARPLTLSPKDDRKGDGRKKNDGGGFKL